MGYVMHDAVIATTSEHRPGGLPDVAAFRESLPEEWRQLVIGPILSITNGYFTYAFLSDGSKYGWETDTQGGEYRSRFAAMFQQRFEDGSTADDVVALGYGRDFRYDLEGKSRPPRAAYVVGGEMGEGA